MGRALTEARINPVWHFGKHMKGHHVTRKHTDLNVATNYSIKGLSSLCQQTYTSYTPVYSNPPSESFKIYSSFEPWVPLSDSTPCSHRTATHSTWENYSIYSVNSRCSYSQFDVLSVNLTFYIQWLIAPLNNSFRNSNSLRSRCTPLQCSSQSTASVAERHGVHEANIPTVSFINTGASSKPTHTTTKIYLRHTQTCSLL
jgi:hypothetical protein